MSNKITYFGIASRGAIRFRDGARDAMKLQLLEWEDCGVEVTIEKFYHKRSDRQNKFYWGVFIESQIDCFKERTGKVLSKEQQHTFNKLNYFFEEVIDVRSGEVYKIPGSSTAFTTVEFEDRLERIRQSYFETFDWQLPIPNEGDFS